MSLICSFLSLLCRVVFLRGRGRGMSWRGISSSGLFQIGPRGSQQHSHKPVGVNPRDITRRRPRGKIGVSNLGRGLEKKKPKTRWWGWTDVHAKTYKQVQKQHFFFSFYQERRTAEITDFQKVALHLFPFPFRLSCHLARTRAFLGLVRAEMSPPHCFHWLFGRQK